MDIKQAAVGLFLLSSAAAFSPTASAQFQLEHCQTFTPSAGSVDESDYNDVRKDRSKVELFDSNRHYSGIKTAKLYYNVADWENHDFQDYYFMRALYTDTSDGVSLQIRLFEQPMIPNTFGMVIGEPNLLMTFDSDDYNISNELQINEAYDWDIDDLNFEDNIYFLEVTLQKDFSYRAPVKWIQNSITLNGIQLCTGIYLDG